jgi:hypothetical protein
LPESLRYKRPTNGVPGNFKKSLAVDPHYVKYPHMFSIDTQSPNILTNERLNFKNEDLNIVDHHDFMDHSPDQIYKQRVSKIKAIVVKVKHKRIKKK